MISRKYRGFFLIIFFIAVVSIISFSLGPGKIVESIGITNVYIVTFFFGVVGGVSFITAAGFYTSLFAFALGGANPFVLALFSAPGVLLGDLVFWYAGCKAKDLLNQSSHTTLHNFSERLRRGPRWRIPIVSYVYTGLTPFPGDFLMVALALIDFPIQRVILPILLGNYTLALIVTLSAIYGINFIAGS